MEQYQLTKSSKIVSKLQISDNTFYVTIVDRHPVINIVLTKNYIDLEQFRSFLEQIETLRESLTRIESLFANLQRPLKKKRR